MSVNSPSPWRNRGVGPLANQQGEAQRLLDQVASRHESQPFVSNTILGIQETARTVLSGSGLVARVLFDEPLNHGSRLSKEKIDGTSAIRPLAQCALLLLRQRSRTSVNERSENTLRELWDVQSTLDDARGSDECVFKRPDRP
jgi:hypothetical protein